MEQREKFVAEATEGNDTITALCGKYGISRKTGYKWINRAAEGLPLCDQSRRPNRQPSKTAEELEALIIQTRRSHPAWGGRTIRAALEASGIEGLPSDKTCCNILKRNGLIEPAEAVKHRAFQRFEKHHCNEMWQTDFKGDFLLGNGVRCYPLTILDDHSRYSIRIEPKVSATDVKSSFIAAFREYGLPIRCCLTTALSSLEPTKDCQPLSVSLWIWIFSPFTEDPSTRKHRGRLNASIVPSSRKLCGRSPLIWLRPQRSLRTGAGFIMKCGLIMRWE